MVVECAVSPPYVKHPNNYGNMYGRTRQRDAVVANATARYIQCWRSGAENRDRTY